MDGVTVIVLICGLVVGLLLGSSRVGDRACRQQSDTDTLRC